MSVNGVWVDANNNPAYAKFPPHGITSCWFDLRDPRVTAAYLDAVVAHGYSAGVYAAWNWRPELTGPQFAEWVDRLLRNIAWKGNAPVCLDIETHDIQGYVVPALTRWRQLRPTRPTWYTLEGFQGGLFHPLDVGHITDLGIRLAPQLYGGDMTPLAHSPVIDLLRAGFDGNMIDGMYDAAAIPYSWRGFAFTQGALP